MLKLPNPVLVPGVPKAVEEGAEPNVAVEVPNKLGCVVVVVVLPNSEVLVPNPVVVWNGPVAVPAGFAPNAL